jgi:hypothetical protein
MNWFDIAFALFLGVAALSILSLVIMLNVLFWTSVKALLPTKEEHKDQP